MAPETGTPDLTDLTVVVGASLPDALRRDVEDAAGAGARLVDGRSEGDLLPHMPAADVVLAGTFTPAMLAAASRLRWVHSVGAGMERLLFPALVASDVIVTNARGAHRVSMPEFVLMAMLAWTHRLPELLRAQARREWISPVADEVAGKTLGLLGYGEIGQAVARRARALGVRCLALRRNPSPATPGDAVERVYGPEDLLEFLGASDFVVNSLPLTAETRGLLGASELQAMRRGAVLIHLGRGPTVDTTALLRALQSGPLGGAVLDVFDAEPLAPESPLWGMDNVMITSHTSGNSVHYMERSLAIFCDNLKRYRAGLPLRNIVDKGLGY